MNSKFAKEIFIMVLLFIVVVFTIGILFYEFFPSNDEKLSSIEYLQSDNVKEALAEIQANTGTDNSEDNTNSLLKSYSVNKEDLSGYQSENYYESGKKDPFAEYSERVEDEVVSVTNVSKETENTTIVAPNTNTVTSNNNSSTSNNIKLTNTVSQSTQVKDNNTNTEKNNNKESQNGDTQVSTSNQNTTGTYFEKPSSK